MIKTPLELLQEISGRAKAQRLVLNLTQTALAQKSGVSLGSIKLFENTGKISLAHLLKIAIALHAEKEFELLFTTPPPTTPLTLDELLKQPKIRKRGRKQ